MPHSRAVRANACTTRFALKPRSIAVERLGLEAVEHRAGVVGSEPGRRGGAVDDLVRHPDERVDVAHVRARPRAEQAAGEAERGRIAGDDGGGGILSRLVVQREPGGLAVAGRGESAGHGTRLSTASARSPQQRARARAAARASRDAARTSSSVSSMRSRSRTRAPLSSRASCASRTAMGPVCASASASLTRGHDAVCRASATRGVRLDSLRSPPASRPACSWRAERADQVVHELEREAEVPAGAMEHRERLLRRAGEHGARAERRAERVDGGLVERGVEDRVGVGEVCRDAVLDVGELACGRDVHGVVEQREQPLAGGGVHVGEGDEPEGLVQQQVAGEDRGGVSEQRRAGGIRSPAHARAAGTRPPRSGCRGARCRGR